MAIPGAMLHQFACQRGRRNYGDMWSIRDSSTVLVASNGHISSAYLTAAMRIASLVFRTRSWCFGYGAYQHPRFSPDMLLRAAELFHTATTAILQAASQLPWSTRRTQFRDFDAMNDTQNPVRFHRGRRSVGVVTPRNSSATPPARCNDHRGLHVRGGAMADMAADSVTRYRWLRPHLPPATRSYSLLDARR